MVVGLSLLHFFTSKTYCTGVGVEEHSMGAHDMVVHSIDVHSVAVLGVHAGVLGVGFPVVGVGVFEGTVS